MISPAPRNNVPAVYPWREVATASGLLSYGPGLEDIVRRAAPLPMPIAFSTAQTLPSFRVQVPTKFDLVINLKTANPRTRSASGCRQPCL
jgi:hypothetical protein